MTYLASRIKLPQNLHYILTVIRFIQYYLIISLCFQWFGVLFVLLYRLAIAIFCTGGIIAGGVCYPDTREKVVYFPQ